MKRILVIGNCGAGKSTFSAKLADILEIPLINLDYHFWNPGWKAVPTPEFDEILAKLVQGESWIMDGNYNRTMQYRLEFADTVFFFDFPRLISLNRAIKRNITGMRVDEIPGCPEKMNFALFKWIWNYPSKQAPAILELLLQYKATINIYHFRSSKDVNRFLVSGKWLS
jgi:adenylate kinase family enzyme